MEQTIKMLNKAGYSLSSASNDIFPATILKDDLPIGFLHKDLTIDLTATNQNLTNEIKKVIDFTVQNNKNELVNNEYRLSYFDNTILTASYDFGVNQPIYKIYDKDDKGELVLINSFDDINKAKSSFIENSGLNNDIKPFVYGLDIQNFIDNIKQKGFDVKSAFNEFNKSYEIVDANEKTVGYITKNNKVKITTEQNKVKNILEKSYMEVSKVPNLQLNNKFFDLLKDFLQDVKLALRITFASDLTQKYHIYDNNTKIADINKNKQIKYVDKGVQEKYQDLVNDVVLKVEHKITQDELLKQQAKEIVNEIDVKTENQLNKNNLTVDEINLLAQIVLSSPDISNNLDQNLKIKLLNNFTQEQQQSKNITEIVDIKAETKPNIEKPLDKNSLEHQVQEFENKENLYKSLSEFNKEQSDKVKDDILKKFGTLDKQQFIKNYDIKQSGTLEQKMQLAKQQADIANSSRGKNEKSQQIEK